MTEGHFAKIYIMSKVKLSFIILFIYVNYFILCIYKNKSFFNSFNP